MTWKIGALTEHPVETQKKVWAAVAQKLSLDIQFVEISEEVKSDPIGKFNDLQGFSAVVLSSQYAGMFMQSWPKLPAEVVETGSADAVICDHKHWWFRSFMKEALKQAIIDAAPQLDTHSLAYITGSDSQSRLSASVAIQLGFQRLTFVAHDQAEVQQMVGRLQRMFFDLEVKILKDTELTLQPNNGSLLLNCVPGNSGEAILDDLPYLNFLKKEGLVVDLPYPYGLKQLQEEADHVGIRHIDGYQLCIRKDFFFLQNLLGSAWTLSKDEHAALWTAASPSASPQ